MGSDYRSAPFGCNNFQQTARLTRRHVLQAGLFSAAGLGFPAVRSSLVRAGEGSGGLPLPKAKACIFLFMWGGPSQLDTFDLKPQAPDTVRGEFKPIATKVPGMQICEHFTKLAQHTDKLSIIRSLWHDDPAHLSSGHATLTGQLAPIVKSDQDPPSPKDSPHLGALLSKVKPARDGLPGFVAMPWKALHPGAPGGEAPGQHGGWLGAAYDGMLLTGDLNDPGWRPTGLTLPADVDLQRLNSRVELMQMLNRQCRLAEQATVGMGEHQRRAWELLGSPRVQQAFDLTRESEATRERYGRNLHGQCVLMARRLVEHGVPLVSVNWHNDGRNFWDTHGDNFNRLKNDLIPPADQALSALLEDLHASGQLDETLVVWVGEFGRNPKITAGNAGREHWPFCYSGLMAGGGIRRGAVYGESDRHAAYPLQNPITPQDMATTILYAMGVPVQETILDREGRPHKIGSGKVISDLLT
jgi:hypothetical protein